MKLTGPQRAQLRRAIMDAFPSHEALERFSDEFLDVPIATIVQPSNLEQQVFELIKWAGAMGRLVELMTQAELANPTNPMLQEFSATLSMPRSGLGEAERIVLQGVGFQNVGAWITRLAALKDAVCRLEVQGEPVGTGFLVGEGCVLTNDHVLSEMLLSVAQDPARLVDAARARFDFGVALEGQAPSDGVLARFSDAMILARSPLEALDYALLNLKATPESPMGKEGRRDHVPLAQRPLTMGEAVLILQHPKGAPLKLSLGSVTEVRSPTNRVVYSANTESGSSGAPCLNSDLSCVALHHWGAVAGNSGVLVSALQADWAAKGLNILP